LGPLLARCSSASPYGTPLVRVLGNLSSGPAGWLDPLLPCGPGLAYLASSASAGLPVRKEALWALANLLGGGPGLREEVGALALAPLLEALAPCEPWGLRKEALRGVANLALEPRAARLLVDRAGRSLSDCAADLLRARADPQLCADCVRLLRALAGSCEQGLRDCVASGGPEALEQLQVSPPLTWLT